MATAVAPKVSTTLPEHVELISKEVTRLKAYYDETGAKCRPSESLDEFVAFCLKRHLPLIRNWKDWSQAFVVPNQLRPGNEISQAIATVVKEWRRGAVQKKGTRAPVPFLDYAYYDGDDEDDEGSNEDGILQAEEEEALEASFCNMFGCHLPLPVRFSTLYRNRTHIGAETDFVYAYGHSVKVREGQAISRAVLADVKKKFKEHQDYIAFWEALFESLGVTWASGKAAKFVLSSAPSDLCKLGDLGEESCYTTGGDYERAKLNIAQIPNSVALLVYKENRIIGRAWGILAPRTGGGEFTNFYLTPKRQLLPGLCATLQQLLALNKEPLPQKGTRLEAILNRDSLDEVFLNGDSVIIAPDGKWRQVRDEVASALTKYREKSFLIERGYYDDSYYDED